MTSNQANSICIREYLHDMNITPKRANSHYGMYYSPFRSETAPSFKVDFRKNLWYDFGSGEGGTMVDLVMKINNCTFREAMKKLNNNEISTITLPEKRACISFKTILKNVRPLKSPALTGYLAQRSINIAVPQRQCLEVHYSIGDKT